MFQMSWGRKKEKGKAVESGGDDLASLRVGHRGPGPKELKHKCPVSTQGREHCHSLAVVLNYLAMTGTVFCISVKINLL